MPEAITECEAHVLSALDRLDGGSRIGILLDHLWIVVPTTHGYAYWLDTFGPERFSFNDAGETLDKAIDRAINHLAQILWNAEMDDYALLSAVPRTVRAELAGWIAFQRCYIRVREAGELAENDRHNAACHMSHLYAREHFAAYLAR
jgi:hypothetical protein